MKTAELRKKVDACVNEADARTLRVVNAVFENSENPNGYELPEMAERLILQAMEESEQGLVRPHDEVMASFKDSNHS